MKVMKDKLVKTGHKGIYYKMKKFSLCSLLFVTLGAAVSIPTYYSNLNTNDKVTSAEQNVSEKVDENVGKNVEEVVVSNPGKIVDSGEMHLINFED